MLLNPMVLQVMDIEERADMMDNETYIGRIRRRALMKVTNGTKPVKPNRPGAKCFLLGRERVKSVLSVR